MNAEVPDAEVDLAVADDLHERVLAEAQGLPGREPEPMAAGQGFGVTQAAVADAIARFA